MTSVGLTGGIGSGKTTVGQMLVELGCRLIDSDTITHELLEGDPEIYDRVVGEFGAEILDADRRIDRRRLGSVVFAEGSRLKALTTILHPAILVRQKAFLLECQSENPNAIAIVDAALMVETGRYKNYDRLIVVTCTMEQQRDRLRNRGLSDDQINTRIRSQMPMEEKTRFADFVIDNSGSVDETHRQVGEVFKKLRKF